MGRVTRPAFRARGVAVGQVLGDWAEIVGPDLAAASQPRRLHAATLTVGCAGPVALELQHSASALAERVNGFYGRRVVERIRFVQQAPPAATPPAPRLPVPEPRPVAGIPDGPLQDALARLSGALRAR